MSFSSKYIPSILLPLLLLMGCTQPDKGASSGADFYVTDVSDERTELVMISQNSGWVVPKEAVYTLKACMVDRSTQEKIRGHKFHVRTPEGVIFESLSTTDSDGCFRWKESFPYNVYAPKTYLVPFSRDIVGTGVYSGARTIEFAVNPWTIGEMARDKGARFVLLNDGSKQRDMIPEDKAIPKEAATAALAGNYRDTTPAAEGTDSSEVARVWVNDVSLKTIRRRAVSDGVIMDIMLSMKPLLKLKDSDGSIITRTVNRGSFDITAYLIVTDTGTNENEKLIITEDGIGGYARIDLEQLTTQLRAKWTKRAHTGNVTLALRLTPRGLDRGVKGFEGLFELGDLNSLTGTSSARVLPTCSHPSDDLSDAVPEINSSDRPCQDFEKFVKSVSNYDDLVKQGYASKYEPLIFDTLKLRFVSILPGETATQREVLYSASTCITDRFNGSKMANIPFVIEYLDDKKNVIPEKTVTKTTNSMGCLMWNSTIHHAYYGPEAFVWHTVRIRTQKEGNNFAKEKRFALNPWDDKFTFGWDEDEFSPEFMKAKKAKSRFFLPRFNYHTVRFLYNIDPFMELEVKKTVLFDLEPRVLRYAGIVNARKQTEPLRDGIYLMKVGIQKDFLDPTERAVDIKVGSRESVSQGGRQVPSVIMKSLGPVTPREYITTDQSLVRVVDGHLIHPIELTMRDLRLMRVRSNFLIQLELVDERIIQAHDVFNQLMKEDFKLLKAKREAKEKARKAAADAREGVSASESYELSERELEQLKAEAISIRQKYKTAFYSMKEQLESQPFINNNFKIDPALLEPVRKVLEVNDFTDVELPGKDEADLNIFIEKGAGLEKRTFVGPVIFLSNAYSDSVRATDNLDEANCAEIEKVGQKRYIEETAEDEELKDFGLNQSLLWENEGVEGVEATKDLRRNKAYRYSRYYGALTHLCNKHVDDLIEREKKYDENYREVMPVASSKANMARTFGLDYMSMVDEPLMELVPDQCDKDPFCKNLRSRTLSRDHVEKLLRYDFDRRAGYFGGWFGLGGNEVIQELKGKSLTEALLPELDYREIGTNGNPFAFKKTVSEPADIFASCSVLSDLAVERMMIISKDQRGQGTLGLVGPRIEKIREQMALTIYRMCAGDQSRNQSAVIVDEKFKVFKTGEDYVFRGGLQLNFNVGTSVSFSRSNSWGGSFKLDDIPSGLKGVLIAGGALIGAAAGPGVIVGATAGLLIGSVADLGLGLIKPVGISRSTSTGNSDGTSVSQGTYLVSQMAKFDVPLESFQRCRITRFSEEFTNKIINNWQMSADLKPFLGKGFMVCGETVNAVNGQSVLRVPETYFYFTQHFTEGDMLDQADLYNHPWLLAMRGIRDFGVFVRNIEAVETTSLSGFWNGLWKPETKPLGWPLDHMAATYRQQTPTFPGFYSLSTHEEGITLFPLNERFSMMATDINAEVNCTMEKSQTQRQTCAEKMAFDKQEAEASIH